jgi:hypothetical protein
MIKLVNKTRRRSTHLTGVAADNLYAATRFAAERGTPINCAISINWTMFSGFGIPDDVRLARLQERLRHRFERQGLELVWWWVREMGGGAPNTHIAAHNAFATNEVFKRLLSDCLEPEGGPNDNAAIYVRLAYNPLGWWRYCCKGLSRQEAKQRLIRPTYQGEIDGKRSGSTQNINRAARERWLTQNLDAPGPEVFELRRQLSKTPKLLAG